MDPKEILSQYVSKRLTGYSIIGLGTGRTVKKLIEHLDREGILNQFKYIASSIDTELEISQRGGLILSLYSGIQPDIYIDSFDVVTKDKVMVKGGGAALLREKILTTFSKSSLFIGEYKKLVKIEQHSVKVPVEIVPVSIMYILKKINEIGFKTSIREGTGKMGGIISDNGNMIIDVEVRINQLCEFDKTIKSIPGIIETGVFCNKYDVVLADEDGRIEIL
ncbi:ribose 5-phosphate isomerase A [Sulfolobus acidocaldarius]|uniref:Ribose 5-phosphate isomerase A n=4 Tax=Sulfolobus acidocaldarius TaxID=2285 RepID=Q4J990_SULAC|nr:ribose 5-phosphate isomerase A [Sulfolobus acidocaldarius]AAY80640.1 ribose 5-phosphate isomerase [Sulfolobus acidocaldarius DSM 639]AGE71236.1 ribose 5-phosphate isomerase [Sulfolobus acidocaldarius N8]AGE73505.1 ribose 5-phosphate isomerase [Sulfolobus acidocaldarius Ron12/I]ALU30496.1 ribose-5-phosphate isomerase [Sulfolobus acidocaldarius]ALU31219.1 ribose-5-phosphate isomerase [Sulfolobus acidocaldarius]